MTWHYQFVDVEEVTVAILDHYGRDGWELVTLREMVRCANADDPLSKMIPFAVLIFKRATE